MTPLTPAEREAIAAYTGHVTVCPPHTFTEGMFYASGSWQREQIPQSTGYNQKVRARGKATTADVRKLMDQGEDLKSIAKAMGLSIEATRVHVKRASHDAA